MEDNYVYLYGRYASPTGNKSKSEVWKQITTTLNSIGPEKTVDNWRKCFLDMKSKIKEKVAKQRRYAHLTGGGGPSDIQLSETEHKLISIFSINSIDGNQQIQELGRSMVTPMLSLQQPITSNNLPPSTLQPIILSPSLTTSQPSLSSTSRSIPPSPVPSRSTHLASQHQQFLQTSTSPIASTSRSTFQSASQPQFLQAAPISPPSTSILSSCSTSQLESHLQLPQTSTSSVPSTPESRSTFLCASQPQILQTSQTADPFTPNSPLDSTLQPSHSDTSSPPPIPTRGTHSPNARVQRPPVLSNMCKESLQLQKDSKKIMRDLKDGQEKNNYLITQQNNLIKENNQLLRDHNNLFKEQNEKILELLSNLINK